MFWTQAKIRRLITQAKQARGVIESLFLSDGTSQGDDKWAWGQFFRDTREHKQYGIYGTSAGAQVLLLAGQGSQNAYVSGARSLLEDAYGSHDVNNRFYKDHHFDRVYKLTFLIEAESADRDTVEEATAPTNDLISRVLPQQGWGEFCNSDSDKDVESRITSTAAALMALSKYRKFRATAECEKAVAWLCRRLTEKAEPAIYELALGILALVEYQSVKDRVSGYDEAIVLTKGRLTDWARRQKSVQLGAEESHHYPTSVDGSRGNRYLFFLPDCLAALAFLRLECPHRSRRYVLNVVDFFVRSIIDKGGFRSISRNHSCTVDHLWIYRLLREFESKEVKCLLPQPFYSWAAMPRLARFLTSALFLGIGGLGLTFTVIAREPGHDIAIWQSVLFGIFATVGLGLFVRSLWVLLRGEG